MAAGVEGAAVICPFMTPAYQASRSCKRELSYADSREAAIVPVMVARNWEASEWLGLVTAGLLWLDFRNAETNDEHFERCLQSLEAEIMYNAGHLLAVAEAPRDVADEPGPYEKRSLKRKPGRRFVHAQSMLYIREAVGEQTWDPDSGIRSKVELCEEPGERGSWEEHKGNGCKYFRNVATNGYLGFHQGEDRGYSTASSQPSEDRLCTTTSSHPNEDCVYTTAGLPQSGDRVYTISGIHPSKGCVYTTGGTQYSEDCVDTTTSSHPSGERVYTTASPHKTEEWLLLTDQMDQSYRRAVIIKNKHTGRFLAVQDGRFVGLTSYTKDCKWFLE